MSDIQKPSFSLLNQKEVDALVDFLNDKRNSINSDVMNQKSIDKLITLITGDSDHIILDLFDPFASDFLAVHQGSADGEVGFVSF